MCSDGRRKVLLYKRSLFKLLSQFPFPYYYNTIIMSDQLTLKRNQIEALLDKIMNYAILQPIHYSIIQKLLWNFKNPSIQQLFLQNLIRKISEQKEVILRLKAWVLIHLILLGTISHETSAVIEHTIQDRQQKNKINSEVQNKETIDRYLQAQVELPFISYLKKLALWKLMSLSALQNDPVSIGFSELNKIKEIMQLKKIFHNYSCYYSSHQYALNLFQTCLLNIKCLWISVCSKIKDITLEALKVNQVLQNEYLLIKQAEVVQDLLIEFVYGDKLALKLPKVLLIKQINLLKPEIKQLENQRKHKFSVENTLGIIKQKKIRKLSTGTIETNKQTKQSPRNDQQLNTDQQIQIMDTINQLQILLSFQN